VLILAIAIGGVTAIFSIAYAVLIRPLPVTDPDRVMLVWGRDVAQSQQVAEVSLRDRRAWLAGQKSFSAIALFGSVNWGELRVTGPGHAFHATRNAVSSGFFDVLGARPMIGRTFLATDDVPTARPTVVLSADVWRQHFSSDRSVVGRLLTVDTGRKTTTFEVIGVMPSDFHFPAGAEVWVALTPAIAGDSGLQQWQTDSVRAMYGVGRLAPGATRRTAAAELSTIARDEELKVGMAHTSMEVVVTPLLNHMLGPARPALFAIAGASAGLLLIACANASALLLVSTAARKREIAIRFALGARRAQVVRLFLCESIVLSIAASVLGVGISYGAFNALVSLVPIDVPRLGEAAIDVRALLFALVLCLGTAFIVGLLPAWRQSEGDLHRGLHESTRSNTAGSSAPARKLLVATQLAAVVILLTAAGLFIRSFTALLRLNLGFDPRGVLTFDVDFPEGKYDTKTKQLALVDAILDRMRQVPGAIAAGAVYQRPFANGAIGMDTSIIVEGQPLAAESASRNPIVNWEAATPDYFAAMRIELLRGRLFNDRDTPTSSLVVIVSESLAARLWQGQSPIGRRVLTYGTPDGKTPVWQTVVGVVEDAKYREVDKSRFDVYLPHRQAPNPVHHFMIRVTGDPYKAVPALRVALTGIDADVQFDRISTMDEVVGKIFAPWRFSSIVVSAFATVALTFAAVGIATLVAFAVTYRTREIGIRVALGAQTRDVVMLCAREGGGTALAGLSVGVIVAWFLRRTVESMLFGVGAGDALTFVGVVLMLGVISVLATYLPARRAARIDPLVALRSE
jgi:predicted permease